MKIRRVLPDFLQQTGDARVTLNLKNTSELSAGLSELGFPASDQRPGQ